MVNVLITGARGFIGKNLVEFLSKKPQIYNVFAPSHSELDLLSEKSVEDFIINNNINVVIHGANVGGTRKSKAENVLEKNLRMFFNIIRCKRYLNKIILLGSGAEYDKRNELCRVSEKDFEISVPIDEYGYSKYLMSKYIEECNDINIVNLRLFGVYGRYEDYEFRFISNSILKNLLEQPIEIMQNVFFDYMYINDCVKVIEWFIENTGKYKFYNVAFGQSIDLLSIAQIINDISNYKSKITVRNEGLNKEYSADNSRLIDEIPDMEITDIKTAILELRDYYLSNILDINQELIVKDIYAKKCNIAK